MKYIQPLTIKTFTELLLSMKDGDEITFGTCVSEEILEGYLSGELIQPEDVENWYFAKLMSLPEYDSRFILIDYCGGGEALAIPLSSDGCDEALDKDLVTSFVKKFYDRCYELKDERSLVYIETTAVVHSDSNK